MAESSLSELENDSYSSGLRGAEHGMRATAVFIERSTRVHVTFPHRIARRRVNVEGDDQAILWNLLFQSIPAVL